MCLIQYCQKTIYLFLFCDKLAGIHVATSDSICLIYSAVCMYTINKNKKYTIIGEKASQLSLMP